jgi:hypothetical protein
MKGKHIFEDSGRLGCGATSVSSTIPTVETSVFVYKVTITPTFSMMAYGAVEV